MKFICYLIFVSLIDLIKTESNEKYCYSSDSIKQYVKHFSSKTVYPMRTIESETNLAYDVPGKLYKLSKKKL